MSEESKPIYHEIPSLTAAEIEKAIAKNNIGTLVIAALSASLYGHNREWARSVCIRLSEHEDPFVRGNAILGFAHMARIDGELDKTLVKPIIERGLSDDDPFVRGQAESAKEDTRWHLKWKYKK